MHTAVVLSAVVAVALGAGTAAAEEIKAQVNAMAFQPLDRTLGVAVRVYDDSAAGKAMAARLTERLTAAGFAMKAEGPLVAQFDTQTIIGTGNPDAKPGRLEVRGGMGGGAGREEYAARFNLYSSKEEPEHTAAFDGAARLEIAVNDRRTGRRLWQGWAVADGATRDLAAASMALIDPLVAIIGQTVRSRTEQVTAP